MLDRLLSIPHLDLGVQFDVEAMVRELTAVDGYVDYEVNTEDPERRYMHRGIWSGRTLFNYTQDSYTGVRHYTPEEHRNLSPTVVLTDLGKMMPTCVSAIQKVGGDRFRARLMRVAPRKRLTWHSHVKLARYSQPPTLLTAHIPILMPKGFRFEVIHDQWFRWSNTGFDGTVVLPEMIQSAWYPPGQCTVFNSLHPHRVVNDSDEERISIMLYLDLNDRRVSDLVAPAVASYTGPFIT